MNASQPGNHQPTRNTQRFSSDPAFNEVEEAFFAAGFEMCAEHAQARVTVESFADLDGGTARQPWWRRLFSRSRMPTLAY